MTVTSEIARLIKYYQEQLLSVTTFLLGFFYFVHVSFLFTQKKKKLRQRLLSATHALCGRLLVDHVRCFTQPFAEALLYFSKEFVLRYFRVVCPYHWREIKDPRINDAKCNTRNSPSLLNHIVDIVYTADRLAQLVECRTAMREVVGSKPRPDQHSRSLNN